MNISDIKKQKERIEYILKFYPATRNSDKELTIEWVKLFYPELIDNINGDNYIKLDTIYDLPPLDSPKRIRAYIQNELKMYPPTDPIVAKNRGWQENEWKIALGYYTINENQFEFSLGVNRINNNTNPWR